MQATQTIGVIAKVTNERPGCNKLRTFYIFKQYEQQTVKSNSILFGTPLLKAQNDKIY